MKKRYVLSDYLLGKADAKKDLDPRKDSEEYLLGYKMELKVQKARHKALQTEFLERRLRESLAENRDIDEMVKGVFKDE